MRNTWWKTGQYNALCDVCGFKFKSVELRQRWDGLMVCEKDWETRHPQELIRPIQDQNKLPWTRPESNDSFISVTSITDPAPQVELPPIIIPDGTTGGVTISPTGTLGEEATGGEVPVGPFVVTVVFPPGTGTTVTTVTIDTSWPDGTVFVFKSPSPGEQQTFTVSNPGGYTVYYPGWVFVPPVDTYSEQQTTFPSSAPWNSVVWSGTKFVAVAGEAGIGAGGYSTKAMYSLDGITWLAATLPTNQCWNGIAWNGSVFCAIGSASGSGTAIAATSPDGISWTNRTMSNTQRWDSIAWNGSVFAANSNGNWAYSSDGIAWNGIVSPLSSGSTSDIAVLGSAFCTLGNGSNSSYTSVDGITWSEHATLPGTNESWYGLASNGTVFCAVVFGGSTMSATSPDGIVWTYRALPVSGNWGGITWNGTYFCITDGAIVLLSTDAINWTQHTLTFPSGGTLGFHPIAGNTTTFTILMPQATGSAIVP